MLLSEAQVLEIRAGVREGVRGPVMLKWIEQLLADRDERIRLADQEKKKERGRRRGTRGRRLRSAFREAADQGNTPQNFPTRRSKGEGYAQGSRVASSRAREQKSLPNTSS